MPALLLLDCPLLAACGEKPAAPRVRRAVGVQTSGAPARSSGTGFRGPRGTSGWRRGSTAPRASGPTRCIVQRWTHVTAKGDSLPLQNFITRYNPGAEKRILFLAHWDTRPITDGPLSPDSTQKVMGANDGASGVALLLGVADVLKRAPPRPTSAWICCSPTARTTATSRRTIDVLIGARYYAAHQPPGPPPLYAVLFDLVADKDLQIYQEGNSATGAPEVVERVWEMARDLGYGRVFVDTPKHTLIDDHVELQKAGIRAIDVVDFDYPASHPVRHHRQGERGEPPDRGGRRDGAGAAGRELAQPALRRSRRRSSSSSSQRCCAA